ncbi:hypothetical protein MDAP_000842 [Mitosporidium daphniae]|uniref:Uncharacterized protein n=1 Tax=Mitosporidium daphniae TaxID=1485682 RepID=A0A098VTW5_9MICR|nr:uncharacterized protein DI09_193p30 [Mitosporidium daphniae]KGG52279.1 hypothetical protein DI09_193p30 [Mitosporidium daphniae]|eukprot:XP_013238715.1 uncharacterized protein DI09_193p30 [Mitosporidium daphniae]
MKVQVFGILCLSLVLFHILLLIEARCPSRKPIESNYCDEKKVPQNINIDFSSAKSIGNCGKEPPKKKRKEPCFNPDNPGGVDVGRIACLTLDKKTGNLINRETGDTYALDLKKPGDSTPQKFCNPFEEPKNEFLSNLVPKIDPKAGPEGLKKELCDGNCASESDDPESVIFESNGEKYVVPGSAVVQSENLEKVLKIVGCKNREPPRHSSNCPFYDSETNGKSKDDQTGQPNQTMQPGESGLTKIPETQKSSSGLSPETLNCPPNSLSRVPVGATMNGVPVGPPMNGVPVGPCANPQNTGPYANPQNTGSCANQQKG